MPLDNSIRGLVIAALVCGGCGAETPPATTQNPVPVTDASLPGAAKDTGAKSKNGAPPARGLQPKTRENPYGR
jgi:hypothetical protein